MIKIAKLLHSPFLILLLVFLVDEVSSSVDNDNGGYKTLRLDLQKQYSLMQMKNKAQSCIFKRPRAEEGTTILEMKQKNHCTNKVDNWDETYKKRLDLDAIHVESLQSRYRSAAFPGQFGKNSESQLPLSSGTRLQILDYIVTINLGGQNLTLMVDTGSDLTWVQCSPCSTTCYKQQEPLYNPSNSSTFQSLPCNSTTCSHLRPETGNSGVCPNGTSINPCDYQIGYGDGSYSRGVLGYERLSFGNVSVDDFIFGCGRDNKGLFGEASGLLGLSRTELSLVSQTSSVFNGVFSYCLPSHGVEASGSLAMGGGNTFSNFKNVTPISYTKMIQNSEMSSFYLLNLTGITVGGVQLDLPHLGTSGKGLSLIDSGTVISRLVPSVYRGLKEEFEKQFVGFERADGFSIFDTCYNVSGVGEVKVPMVVFGFEGGAEMVVDVEGILYVVESDGSKVCLAFKSSGSDNNAMILGNYQQKNQRVVYDLKQSKLGFAREPCGF